MTEKLHKMVNGVRIELSETEAAEMLADWAASAEAQKAVDYEALRKSAYPSAEKQLEMMYQDKINGTDTWATLIASINNQYPKP